jgi:RND superfamily putative drug exporter
VADALARWIIAGRVAIVVGWIAAAAAATTYLPTLQEAQTGALGQLIPADSRALEAEKLSADLFRFPLASRTAIVERDADGMPAARVRAVVELVDDINGERTRGIRADGAYGVTNVGVPLGFARESDTTTVTSLLFGTDVNQRRRVDAAHAYVRALAAPEAVTWV